MTAEDTEWAKAYARQALSDLEAREILLEGKAHRCHTLHFLQMAAEKVCKAYLVTVNGEDSVRKVHNYIQTVLPVIARQMVSERGRSRLQPWQFSQIKALARDIELLAPACHESGTRPDNSEYPWSDAGGTIHVPCQWKFKNIDESERIFMTVVQVIRTAADEYLQTSFV